MKNRPSPVVRFGVTAAIVVAALAAETAPATMLHKGILGKKLGMTRVFLENGDAVACTLVEAGPCTVVQRKTEATDGYEAIQVGFLLLATALLTPSLQQLVVDSLARVPRIADP